MYSSTEPSCAYGFLSTEEEQVLLKRITACSGSNVKVCVMQPASPHELTKERQLTVSFRTLYSLTGMSVLGAACGTTAKLDRSGGVLP